MRVLPLLLLVSSVSASVSAAEIDDFAKFPWLWQSSPGVKLSNPSQALRVDGPVHAAVRVAGRYCRPGLVDVTVMGSPLVDARAIEVSSVTLGVARAVRARLGDANRDRTPDLTLSFVGHDTCGLTGVPLNGRLRDGRAFTAGGADARAAHPFAASQDWSLAEGLTFKYLGQATGKTLAIELRDNRAPDPGPAGWRLVWSDEFSGAAGRPPNPAIWTHDVGDGTANGIPGWGNNEREYYTDRTANAALDGQGHLAITARLADGSLACYYGPCQYTSARLTSQGKAEFAHGRIEARMKVPAGAGLWPAFWSLGTNIGDVGWPTSGEIDVMEFVGRLPDIVTGSIHGPGYSGGSANNGTHDFGGPVSDGFHTFAVEWQPGQIRWLVDGIVYHTATPADVAPNQWVFDHPFFLMLNFALGGFFPGDVDPNLQFPKTLLVDYVRVYQASDTAERFRATFVDDVAGWRDVTIPFSDFARSANQPEGAPDDGLGLTEIWGYGLVLPQDGLTGDGSATIDDVQLARPTTVAVTSTADDGPGSLRRAMATVAANGTIAIDASLAGATLTLTSGPLWPHAGQAFTVDGSAAPGFTIDGNGADRVLIVDGGATVAFSHVVLTHGASFDVGGGVLDNGTLTLDHVVVSNNLLQSGDNQWWKGGGGVFVGDNAVLTLDACTVSGNSTQLVDGGGIYARMGTTVHITASTISGNTAGNVGGGVRMLGNATIANSTIDGNTSAWHGSALFQTDGASSIVNSTITDNHQPGGTAAIFVGTFTDANAGLTLTNTIVSGNQDYACQFMVAAGLTGGHRVYLASGGHNVFGDGSCAPADTAGPPPAPASDQIVGNAMVGPLANNGGPTLTNLPLGGSPAIDAADPAACPATDQRGIARPQGAGCDAGAVEVEP